MLAPTLHSSISSGNLVCSYWWPSEDDASKEAQHGPKWDGVVRAAGALPPQPRGTVITSKGVKVLRPQEKQGFGRWVSWYFQAEAAATNLQAVGRALQCFLLARAGHGCCVQTSECELAPRCQTQWLLNTAVSNMQARAEPSLSPLHSQDAGGALGCRAVSREREKNYLVALPVRGSAGESMTTLLTAEKNCHCSQSSCCLHRDHIVFIFGLVFVGFFPSFRQENASNAKMLQVFNSRLNITNCRDLQIKPRHRSKPKPVKIHLGIYVTWVENFLACIEIR